MEKILCGHCGNVHYENFCPQWKERGIFEVDWLVECIYKHTGQENTHKSDKELASAIREKIRKRKPKTPFTENPTLKLLMEERIKALADYDKALGI